MREKELKERICGGKWIRLTCLTHSLSSFLNPPDVWLGMTLEWMVSATSNLWSRQYNGWSVVIVRYGELRWYSLCVKRKNGGGNGKVRFYGLVVHLSLF